MFFIKILLKSLVAAVFGIIFRLQVIATLELKSDGAGSGVQTEDSRNGFSFAKSYLASFIRKLGTRFPNLTNFSRLNKQLQLKKPQENKYLLIIICWLFRINLDKDFEFILDKKFSKSLNISEYSAGAELRKENINSLLISRNKDIYDTIENKVVNTSMDLLFSESNKHVPVENLFLHNKTTPLNLLTQNSDLNINFKALEDFYSYLKMFGDEEKLSKYPSEIVFKNNPKTRKKERIPKNFRGGSLLNRGPLPKSNISEKMLKHQVNILKQVEFLLKNKALLLSKKIILKDLDIHAEVKSIMYSYYNPVGPYGSDTVVYNGDLVSKNKLMVSRRVNLIKDQTKINDLKSFDLKIGFFNFNAAENEEWEYSSDVPSGGGWFTGQFYFINPFLVLGFILYSIFELVILLYIMSFFLETLMIIFYFS